MLYSIKKTKIYSLKSPDLQILMRYGRLFDDWHGDCSNFLLQQMCFASTLSLS